MQHFSNPPRVRFPTPIATKAGPMPPHQRLRLDNRYDLQDRWKPSIHLDEEPAVVVGRLSSTPHPAPQDDQLMPEHRILRFKPQLRLEWRGQDGQSETEQSDHSASLGDSITSSTQIRFSVHTVEDVPPQSCRRYRRDRSVRRADNLVPSAPWFVDHGAWQTTGHMVRSNDASDRGMDRKPDNRSLRMGAASPLSDPRSGWRVW